MKLIIDIDYKTYKVFKRDNFLNMGTDELWDAIRKGTPINYPKCKDCILDDEKGCVLEYYPCIYEALEYVGRRKSKNDQENSGL